MLKTASVWVPGKCSSSSQLNGVCSSGWWRGDQWRAGFQLLQPSLCVEILYSVGATLHPLFMCEELGQKETKKTAALSFYFKRNLEHLQQMKEENWRRESKSISFIILL